MDLKEILTSEEYQEYVKIIADAARDQVNSDIPNSSLAHAAIGINSLINNAGETIRIVSRDFYAEFYSEFMDDFVSFLSKSDSNTLRVVLLEDVGRGILLLKGLMTRFGDRVKVAVIDEQKLARNLNVTKKKVPNFFVITPCGYRYETSDEGRAQSLVRGTINFGNKEISEALSGTFDILEEMATEPLIC